MAESQCVGVGCVSGDDTSGVAPTPQPCSAGDDASGVASGEHALLRTEDNDSSKLSPISPVKSLLGVLIRS